MRSLKRSLSEYPLPVLQGIARNLGLSTAPPDVDTAAGEIAARLLDESLLQEVLAGLSPQAREALASVQRASVPLLWATFCRRFGPVREMGPQRLVREQPWRQPQSAAEELLYRGLVYHGLRRLEDEVSDVVYIPPEIRLLLPPVPAERRFALPPHPEPERWQRAGSAFLQDLVVLLAHIYNEELHVDWEGRPLRGELAQIGQKLRVPLQPDDLLHPPPRVHLLFHHVRALGLVFQEGDRLHIQPQALNRWLKQPMAYQRFVLWRAWAESPRWNDLCYVPELECVEGGWKNDPLATRRRLFRSLSQLSSRQWHRLSDWVDAIYERAPDFQRPQGNYQTWLIRRRGEESVLRGFEHWHDVEGRLLSFYLVGPMAWLDAVALDTEGHVFALTSAGYRWLHKRSESMRKERPHLQVTPDFRIHLPLNVRALDHFRVARIAEWEQSTPGYVYRLSRSSLARAHRQGISVQRLTTFLRHSTGNRVPRTVMAALKRWEQQHVSRP